MAQKEKELNVDFIGNQEGLTKEEEKALSDFFEKRKLASSKGQGKGKPKTAKKRKVTN